MEFLTNLVFGCPEQVTTPLGTARATYDARGRLISYGTSPDYQTTYGWDDDDRLITRNGKSVSVTRTPDEIVYIEDGFRDSLKLDEQSRPVAFGGMLTMVFGWRGDALVSLHWEVARLSPLDATFGQCGDRAPARAAVPGPR
jgi:YD repeat-containing protein